MLGLWAIVTARPLLALDAPALLDAKTQLLAAQVQRLEEFRQIHSFYGNPCDLICVQNYQAHRLEILRVLQEGSVLREQVKVSDSLQRWEIMAKRINSLLLATQPR